MAVGDVLSASAIEAVPVVSSPATRKHVRAEKRYGALLTPTQIATPGATMVDHHSHALYFPPDQTFAFVP